MTRFIFNARPVSKMGNSERKNLLTRREFFAIGCLATAGVMAASWKIGEYLGGNFEPVGNLERLANFTVFPAEIPTPANLRGIIMNSPFLWSYIRIPSSVDLAVENARAFGARAIRVFISDTYEPELAHLQPWVLDNIKALAEKFPLMVDFFDAYPLLHSQKPNLIYGSQPLTSPYLVKAEGSFLVDQQLAFFVEPNLKERFLNRVRSIINSLKSSNIATWSVANELVPPLGTLAEKKEILTKWYEAVLPEIRRADKTRPIVSGVADPTLLDEDRLKIAGLTANTIHLYPDAPANLARILARRQKCLPLIIQEIGFPARVSGIKLGALRDELMASFLVDRFLRFMRIDEKKRTIRPETESLGIWRLSFEGDLHDDGFQVEPKSLPKTVSVLQTWRSILKKVS